MPCSNRLSWLAAILNGWQNPWVYDEGLIYDEGLRYEEFGEQKLELDICHPLYLLSATIYLLDGAIETTKIFYTWENIKIIYYIKFMNLNAFIQGLNPNSKYIKHEGEYGPIAGCCGIFAFLNLFAYS